MSYSSKAQALENAVRMMQEGGAMMVKLEGGLGQIGIVEHLTEHDIPVCAHIGLKPQSVHKIGGFKVQGRDDSEARKMVEDAIGLERAGAVERVGQRSHVAKAGPDQMDGAALPSEPVTRGTERVGPFPCGGLLSFGGLVALEELLDRPAGQIGEGGPLGPRELLEVLQDVALCFAGP